MNNITISTQGVSKLLRQINPHKATGPDQICGKVLKELSEEIATIITCIFQKTLDSGKIPTDWKHANVCPVFKKGDKRNAINYRPISLTCILSKIMEHIIASNIMSHLEKRTFYMTYNMAFDHQDHVKPSLSHSYKSYLETTTTIFKQT